MPSIEQARMMDTEIDSPSQYQIPEVQEFHQYEEHQQSVLSSPPPSLAAPTSQVHDLICIGLGPASLAIAIALHETLPSSPSSPSAPKTLFLERQPQFAWHSGMQLPGAKMQISFLKDLATPRNPASRFSFISYLHAKGRFHDFVNLGTFLPSRCEYEDYLRWCAGFFEARGAVRYGAEVVSVSPVHNGKGPVKLFKITSKDLRSGELSHIYTRHVVLALGGIGRVPSSLSAIHPRVIHSSQYSHRLATALPSPTAQYTIAVLGNGQSAAEIFNDLSSRYSNAKVVMLIKGSALRPSDDSPFVNEVFNPDRVDGIFTRKAVERNAEIVADRATNYGVVREGLLEVLFEKLYMQKLASPNPGDWKLEIRSNRLISSSSETSDGKLGLKIQNLREGGTEELKVDAIFVATGYVRNAHEEILKETRGLLPQGSREQGTRFPVGRDYGIRFEQGKVAANAGVWLQGCNEVTHGLSDTLLSILAVRAGELVNSIFHNEIIDQTIRAKL